MKLFRAKPIFNQRFVIVPPYVWLLLFLLLPLLMVMKLSFSTTILAQPPYEPLLYFKNDVLQVLVHFENYITTLTDPFYFNAFTKSITVAFVSMLICLIIGFPMAYFIARSPEEQRPLWLLLVMLPSWTSFLLRIYSWLTILQSNGIINNLLMKLGIINEPLPLLYNLFAVYLGIVYAYLPFMVLPIYVALVRLDWNLLEAAANLGASARTIFLRITVPLSLSGVLAGCLLVFIPAIGEFVIPDILGGAKANMIGKVIWQEFFVNRDWPMAASIAVITLIILLVPIVLFNMYQEENQRRYKEGTE